MEKLINILDKLNNLIGYASGWMVPLMVVLVAVEVFMRYILHTPPMVADEFSAYLLVALSMMGLAYTWRQGGHVRITILVSRLPVKVASYTRLFTLILTFVFMIGITKSAFDMIVYAREIGLKSDTWLVFPLFWPQLTIFIGFFMLTLILFVEIYKILQNIRRRSVEESK